MNNKGFTLIELLSIIVIIGILGTIGVITLNPLINKQKNKVYVNYENTLKTTVENYMITDFQNNGSLLPMPGRSIEITANELISLKLLENLNDPKGGSCDDSYVIVTRNNNNSSGNLSLDYNVCLVCNNYVTANCSVIKSAIVYDANGGNYTPNKTVINENGGTKITLDKPVKGNLNFLGWSTNPNATIPEYYSGDTYIGTDSVRLYAIYGEVQNKMGVLGANPNLIPYNTSISEINFVNMNQSNINTAYNNASIKFDFTASGSNNGSVLGWLTTDPNDASKYILTVASDGTTYFTTGNCLFNGWNYQENDDYNFINLTTINLTNIDTSQVVDMNSMFYNCQSLTNLDVSNFNTSKVTDMSYMFYYCQSLTNLDVSNFNTSNVTNMYCMFYDCESLISLDLSRFNTSKVTNMLWMFCCCYALTNLDVSNFDTSKITDMNYMFYECYALTSLDLSSFDTSKVTDMSYMFEYCESLISLDVSSFNTSNVTDMSEMFCYCYALTSLDVSSFNTSNVTDMVSMFYGCESLTSLDVSSFNTSKVTDMSYMFGSCYHSGIDGSLIGGDNNLEEIIGLGNFDTSKVTGMWYMFAGCTKLTDLDLSSFNTNNVTATQGMFYRCNSLESLDISKFNLSSSNTKLTKFANMFTSIPVACQVKVKDSAAQTWVLTASNNHNASWSTSNVVIKS